MADWTVYGQDNCVYCKKAINMLKIEGEGAKVTYRHIKEHPDPKQFKTVPQIYRGDQHIGGYTELYEAFYG